MNPPTSEPGSFESEVLGHLVAIRTELEGIVSRLDAAEAASKAIVADLKSKLENTAIGRMILGPKTG